MADSIDVSTIPSAGNITIAASSGLGNYSLNYPSMNFGNISNSAQSSGLKVSGDAEFEGDIKIKGKSITELLKGIEDRLAILVPDPEKLEHFEALKKAYDHYKTLEALCQLPDKEEK